MASGLPETSTNTSASPFWLHRLCLQPLLCVEQSTDFSIYIPEIEKAGRDIFINFIRDNCLAPLWHHVLETRFPASPVVYALHDELLPDRRLAAAMYMRQKHTLEKLHDLFAGHGLQYALFKGAQIREFIYQSPELRPVCDIDVLVNVVDRDRAIKTLLDAGMVLIAKPENLSHECTLMDGHVAVDLHWHVLRPGRLNTEMTTILMQQSRYSHGFYSLNDLATLFIMLVHPAFTKYVCSPYAHLVRLVDLIHWLDTCTINTDEVVSLLHNSHLKTAAWATLFWQNLIVDHPRSISIMNRIKPPVAQKKYLQFWITRNLPTRLLQHRNLIRLAFTLALHDSPRDAINAAFRLSRQIQNKPADNI